MSIYLLHFDIHSESIQNALHDFSLTNQRDWNRFFRVVHPESLSRITGDIKILRNGISRCLQNLRLRFYPINAECSDILFFRDNRLSNNSSPHSR